MTAQELEKEYREAERKRVTMDIRTLADYVVDVVIPREREAAANWMLESVIGSLKAYPGGGGDERMMREVELIVWEKRAFDNQFSN